MGMAAPIYYTADMVRAMPDDGNRYEVVYGELLVTPAPRLWHQALVKRLSFELEDYLRRSPVGELLNAPADISWGPDVLVHPDVFVADLGGGRRRALRRGLDAKGRFPRRRARAAGVGAVRSEPAVHADPRGALPAALSGAFLT
ncbi:MAG TPA: Uma2 family endonuclease [Gemmatimonadales bacterium]